MALTLAQIQALITNKADPRQIINEFADYLQANPPSPGGSSYLSYKANGSQADEDAPVSAVVGENTIGAIVWTRQNTGRYAGTLAGAFTANKTFVTATSRSGSSKIINATRDSDNIILVYAFNSVDGSEVDDNEWSISIEVHP